MSTSGCLSRQFIGGINSFSFDCKSSTNRIGDLVTNERDCPEKSNSSFERLSLEEDHHETTPSAPRFVCSACHLFHLRRNCFRSGNYCSSIGTGHWPDWRSRQ